MSGGCPGRAKERNLHHRRCFIIYVHSTPPNLVVIIEFGTGLFQGTSPESNESGIYVELISHPDINEADF